MLIDTHTHLYVSQFDTDREQALERAQKEGVSHFFLPNIDVSSIEAVREMEQNHPGIVHPMMGLHPCSVKADFKEQLARIQQELSEADYCGIGEVGIDLYWDKTFFEEQKEAFTTQMNWAVSLNKPVIIHSRESTEIIIEMIAKRRSPQLWGIFHCFTGTEDQARRIIDLGFHLGIGGVLTFKNAGLRESLKDIPLEKLVLETDSPYLAPVPYRGKRNESSYIRLVAEQLATVKGVPVAEIEKVTSQNAREVFRDVLID